LVDIKEDPEGEKMMKVKGYFKLIDIIEDYDLIFLINKTMYTYLATFISFQEENELPQYEA
jgi:hypothetical protein